MDETTMSRIPFSRDEEQTIAGMARWMRFMAVVGIVAGSLMLFVLVLGVGILSAARYLGDTSPQWAKARTFFDDAGPVVYLMGAVFALTAAVTLCQNFALYRAGDYFHLVARTDTDDLDYLARGLDRLRLVFKLQVLAVVVTIAVAFGTVAATLALTRYAS